jgi:hypothetical protein
VPPFPADDILRRLDRNLLKDGEVVPVTETAEDGAGTLSLTMRAKSLAVRLHRTIPWLSEGKCADAIVFEFLPERLIIHVIELKKQVKLDTWRDMRRQLRGAFHNALALAGVLQITSIDEIQIHVAYTADLVTARESAVPSSLKQGVGRKPRADARDWETRRMQIDDRPDIPINLILRGPDGDAAAQIA